MRHAGLWMPLITTHRSCRSGSCHAWTCRLTCGPCPDGEAALSPAGFFPPQRFPQTCVVDLATFSHHGPAATSSCSRSGTEHSHCKQSPSPGEVAYRTRIDKLLGSRVRLGGVLTGDLEGRLGATKLRPETGDVGDVCASRRLEGLALRSPKRRRLRVAVSIDLLERRPDATEAVSLQQAPGDQALLLRA